MRPPVACDCNPAQLFGVESELSKAEVRADRGQAGRCRGGEAGAGADRDARWPLASEENMLPRNKLPGIPVGRSVGLLFRSRGEGPAAVIVLPCLGLKIGKGTQLRVGFVQ